MKKRIVFFDLDSTLCALEGLDFLAEMKGVGDKVKVLTEKSMNGELDYEEVMRIKLELIAPSQQDLERLAEKYLENITEGASEAVSVLKKLGFEVFMVTGNFYEPALAVAKKVGIKKENVFASKVFLDENGNYKGVDFNQPLFKTKGKAVVVKKILENFPESISFFVGDGSTDLAVKGIVDYFVGFGGVVERERVKKQADFFAHSFDEVVKIIEKVVV